MLCLGVLSWETPSAAPIPKWLSSVYHYFGSQDGILLAVMERGADRFFADLPRVGRETPAHSAERLFRNGWLPCRARSAPG
jgi:AcrR family transcriptional regulator